MKVVNGILRSYGITFSDVTRATAYLKHRADAPASAEWCSENSMNLLPTVTLQADICRQELLFEIEVDAPS